MAFRINSRFNCMPCNEYISISRMWEGKAIIGMLVHAFVRANVQIIYFERDITFHFPDATAEENMSTAINCYGDHVEGVRFRIYLARKTHPAADIWRSNEVGWWKWNSCCDTVNIRQWEMLCFLSLLPSKNSTDTSTNVWHNQNLAEEMYWKTDWTYIVSHNLKKLISFHFTFKWAAFSDCSCLRYGIS